MVSFHLTYQGGLRCEAIHDPSQVKIVTDAPVDNRGRGESFSPTDLVVTGLGVCMLTTMGIAVQKENFNLNGSRVYMEKHMSTDPPRRISMIVARIDFPPQIPRDKRLYLEHIARTCPVVRSLHPEITVDLTFSYPD